MQCPRPPLPMSPVKDKVTLLLARLQPLLGVPRGLPWVAGTGESCGDTGTKPGSQALRVRFAGPPCAVAGPWTGRAAAVAAPILPRAQTPVFLPPCHGQGRQSSPELPAAHPLP